MTAIEENIKKIFEEYRPYLQKDGGDIEFIEINDQNEVIVKFFDSCLDCQFKEQTKKVIELQIKKIFPQLTCIKEVENK
jgi:Fe-S cluster biogenesis protein NfuA